MPYQVTWYTEPQIILYDYNGVLTLDEVNQSNIEALELMNQASEPVDFLVDLRYVERITFNISEMLAVQSLHAMITHPLNHWTAYYDKRSSLAQLLMHVLHESVQGRSRFFDSQAEALEFLQTIQD